MDKELHRILYFGNKCTKSVVKFDDAYVERQRIKLDLWGGP